MGRRTILCIWLGFALFAARTLYPPWLAAIDIPNEKAEWPLWSAPLNNPPDWDADRFYHSQLGYTVRVDYGRLALELAVAESFALALYLTWARRRDLRPIPKT